jgi:hypothetical protein
MRLNARHGGTELLPDVSIDAIRAWCLYQGIDSLDLPTWDAWAAEAFEESYAGMWASREQNARRVAEELGESVESVLARFESYDPTEMAFLPAPRGAGVFVFLDLGRPLWMAEERDEPIAPLRAVPGAR